MPIMTDLLEDQVGSWRVGVVRRDDKIVDIEVVLPMSSDWQLHFHMPIPPADPERYMPLAQLLADSGRLAMACKQLVKWYGERWPDDDTLKSPDLQTPELRAIMLLLAGIGVEVK